ncbi:MAG: HTH domain-containing protein [Desulfosporosinus sp.]|nr:HTH domain-containing protein [Desulfosporosinus sp.]
MDGLNHTERLLNLVYMIQNSPGIQAGELAKMFGRTTRTIQRDIYNLRKAGFDITSSTGGAGGFAVATHVIWRLTKYRQRRRLTVVNKAGILAEKVEKPS